MKEKESKTTPLPTPNIELDDDTYSALGLSRIIEDYVSKIGPFNTLGVLLVQQEFLIKGFKRKGE